jgi:hypothetical protein
MVCHNCNTGWMAKLEALAAPLLTPMISGRPTSLNPVEQIVAATWATKTVMVAEPTLGREENFPLDQREIVMRYRRPPGLLRVRSAAIEGPIPPARYACVRVQVNRDGEHFFQLHLYTLQINTLVLQVMRPHPPPPNYGALKRWAVPEDKEVPLFPPVNEFYWPPKISLHNGAEFDHFVARGNVGDLPPTFPT